jgi:hypothetical protein
MVQSRWATHPLNQSLMLLELWEHEVLFQPLICRIYHPQ